MFEALDRRCDGHRGLPHAVLTSESVRLFSFLPKQLVDLFVKIMVKTRIHFVPEKFGIDVRMTRRFSNLLMC